MSSCACVLAGRGGWQRAEQAARAAASVAAADQTCGSLSPLVASPACRMQQPHCRSRCLLLVPAVCPASGTWACSKTASGTARAPSTTAAALGTRASGSAGASTARVCTCLRTAASSVGSSWTTGLCWPPGLCWGLRAPLQQPLRLPAAPPCTARMGSCRAVQQELQQRAAAAATVRWHELVLMSQARKTIKALHSWLPVLRAPPSPHQQHG